MPAGFAHYRFGLQLLPTLPGEVRSVICRHRGLYDLGLHGPDIFLYYDPVRKNKVGPLCRRYHEQSGRELFGRICRQGLSQPELAYLYGLLAHYSLDALCHPFVWQQTRDGSLGHLALETEFDRYLLEKDGLLPPHLQDFSGHMKLSAADCAVAAGFYPELKPADISRSLRNMATATRLLAKPDPLFRKLMAAVLALTPKYSQMLMGPEPDPRCAHLGGDLEDLYQQALALYPRLLDQILARLAGGAELGREFDPVFDIY